MVRRTIPDTVCFFAGEAQAPSYTGSDIPDQVVDDNENAAPPPPSAPPADMFGSYAGYENVNFGKWLLSQCKIKGYLKTKLIQS